MPLECAVLNSKVGEKEIVIKELEKQLKELSERDTFKEDAYAKEKRKFEEQLVLKERELNRIEKEYKEEKTTLSQKVVFAER